MTVETIKEAIVHPSSSASRANKLPKKALAVNEGLLPFNTPEKEKNMSKAEKAKAARNGIKTGEFAHKLAAFVPRGSAVLCNEQRRGP